MRLLDIHIPVAYSVQCPSEDKRIVHRPREIQRAVQIAACLFIIAPGPEIAKSKKALPFPIAIMCRACRFECSCVIITCCCKITEQFVAMPAGPIEPE